MRIEREDLLRKLADWEIGKTSTIEIHQWAVSIHPAICTDWELSSGEENSVTNETLDQLDMLDINLISVADVPALVKFLNTPEGEFETGYRDLEYYLGSRSKGQLNRLKLEEPYARVFKAPPNQ